VFAGAVVADGVGADELVADREIALAHPVLADQLNEHGAASSIVISTPTVPPALAA
jgi:hypothetical protein